MANKFKKQQIRVYTTLRGATSSLGEKRLFIDNGEDKHIYFCFQTINIQINYDSIIVYYEK